MAFTNETLCTESPREFCLALKAARERQGVTLATIADATKLQSALFAALERGDLRHWPKGLYRRCFFRNYVQMIGVDVAEVSAEFARLFPDGEGPETPKAAGTANEGEPNFVRLVTVLVNAGRRFAAALNPPSASKVS